MAEIRRFEPDAVEQRVTAMPAAARLAFAACLCERMLPAFKAFSDATGWGDPRVLRSCIDIVWRQAHALAQDAYAIPPEVRSLISACDAQAPDTEDFDHPLTSPALDASNVVAESLD